MSGTEQSWGKIPAESALQVKQTLAAVRKTFKSEDYMGSFFDRDHMLFTRLANIPGMAAVILEVYLEQAAKFTAGNGPATDALTVANIEEAFVGEPEERDEAIYFETWLSDYMACLTSVVIEIADSAILE